MPKDVWRDVGWQVRDLPMRVQCFASFGIGPPPRDDGNTTSLTRGSSRSTAQAASKVVALTGRPWAGQEGRPRSKIDFGPSQI